MRSLVWFRGKDLRVADHAPLGRAVQGGELIPLFVLDPYFFAPPRAQALPHRIQFLLESLASLAQNLAHLGSRLVVIEGKSVDVVPMLAARWRVDRVLAHRWTEPFARDRDLRVQKALEVPFELFEGELLKPPGTLRSGSGSPYAAFTPFSKAWAREAQIESPLPAPKSLPPLPAEVTESGAIPTLESLGITRNPSIQAGGERAARQRLDTFLTKAAARYDEDRNRMDIEGTSRLSADLKFGTLSVRTVWQRAKAALAKAHPEAWRIFSNELVWREFSHHVLWDRPTLLSDPFRKDFVGFPWREDDAGWRAWTAGRTGYPVVDAAARQLLGEGFVHNRARMISASFLTKHLLLDYKAGEAHYLKWLTDGDWAQNNMGWQWSSGSGCDAQPYFRVFNPITQGEKFDPKGDYVRRWVPELARLSAEHIHAPWRAPAAALLEAGVILGETYPQPIVNHEVARERFLGTAKAHIKRAGVAS